MLNRFRNSLLFFLIGYCTHAQVQKEIIPPYNIKTISFVQDGVNVTPIFELTGRFEFQFDDLFGNEANYYYQLLLCDYNWKPSELSKNEYLRGTDDLRIQDYTNSYNTLQLYSHYSLQLPNRNTGFLKSGNYMLQILNDDKEIVFTRRFIVYENLVSVPLQVKRSINVSAINFKHNLDFTIKSPNLMFQNPMTNIKVLLFQNSEFNSGITNLKPMYTMGNDLIYKYNTETEFWAGNEYLYFDSKDIKNANNYISYVDSKNGMYNSHLYTNEARANKHYTNFADSNGNFTVNNSRAENNSIESDYSWVFFSLSAPSYYGKKDIYIVGMFNNYALTPENKMDYIPESGLYEKSIMIKQGYTNYQYVIADKDGVIDYQNAIDGNFSQTENNYTVLVYYRENNQRYDRVIGLGKASSVDIIN